MTEFKVGDEVFVNTRYPRNTFANISVTEGAQGVVTNDVTDSPIDEDGDVWVDFDGCCAYVSPECLSLVNPPQENNPVSPSHYAEGMPEGIQVIDIIKAQSADYLHGNVIKYVLRWKFKNGVEDLKKARVYIDWLIEQEESRT